VEILKFHKTKVFFDSEYLFHSSFKNVVLIFVNFISGLTDTAVKRIDSDLQGLIPIDAPITLDTERSHSVAKKLREFYFDNQPLSEDTKAKYADVCILLFYSLL
jgi:hypothetical protein